MTILSPKPVRHVNPGPTYDCGPSLRKGIDCNETSAISDD